MESTAVEADDDIGVWQQFAGLLKGSDVLVSARPP